MQIEDDHAIQSERAEQSVLNLKVARLKAAIESRENDHDGREGESSPIVCKKSPSRGGGGERSEIGMKVEQPAIESGAEGFFPARADVESVEIERDAANGEEDAGLRGKVFCFGTQHDQRAEVVSEKIDADEQAG